MSSVVFDSLYPCTFRGIPFFYISGEITSGRKTVTHEYPHKDFRFVEDLGLELDTYSIKGIVSGRLYSLQRFALQEVLKLKGIGIFTHPLEGIIKVVAIRYTISESLTYVGLAEFNITFEQANPGVFPSGTANNISKLAQIFKQIYDDVGNEFNKNYNTGTNRNITDAANKLKSLNDGLIKSGRQTTADAETSKTFNIESQKFNDSTFIIAGIGDTGNETSSLISDFDSLSIDPNDRFDASKRIIGFGEDDEFLNIDTIEINERNNNTKLINGLLNGLAFINMIDSAKNIEYDDEDELNDAADILDAAFNQIESADSNIFTANFLDQINEMRNQIRIFFEQQRLIVNKIIEIETPPLPMTVIAYKYYGNTNEYRDLLTLNDITNPAIVSGEIRILEA